MEEISVVIPLYNKAPYIDRSLNSVLSQTFLPKEIIVVDDGSTDGGEDIVKNYNHPLIRLISKKNEGVSATRNRGVLEATGSLIAFLDADDCWQPRFLEVIHNLRQQFPQAGIYATNFELVRPNGEIKKYTWNCLPPDSQAVLISQYIEVLAHLPMHMSATAMPKHILQEIGGFNQDEYLYEDVDLVLRIGLRYPIAWSSEPLARYHQDALNRALGTRLWVREPAVSVTIRQAIADGLVPENLINMLKEYSHQVQMQAAVHCIHQGQKEMASQLLAYSRSTKKYRSLWWQCFILNLLPGGTGSFILMAKKRITGALGFFN
ncbi:MAG: glycosyltransferase family 2 protein [Legionellales bacterium]